MNKVELELSERHTIIDGKNMVVKVTGVPISCPYGDIDYKIPDHFYTFWANAGQSKYTLFDNLFAPFCPGIWKV